jgi:hypothetical protein
VAGTWRIERKKSAAILTLEPFRPLSRKDRADLAAEGTALAGFLEDRAESIEVRGG